jgi:DNA-binding transcriptional regulator GbsR (MarR family)
MTEITKTTLTPVQQKFILHWGEMGTRWGINRTVAQIHALLFLSPTPLHAEGIAATLGVARSNVSTSLRELQGWGIVRVTHILGDRRDHFESVKDVWEMFRIIVDERKKREADPTLAMLREAVAETKKPGAADAYTRERLADLLQFFELMTTWCEQTRKLPTPAVIRMVKMGSKVAKMLGQ